MRKVLLLLVSLIAVTIAGFWQDIQQAVSLKLPIRYVRVEGAFQYISKETLKALLLPYVTRDFFSVDVQEIDRAAQQHPWVETVRVRRVWPNAINVQLVEQRPAVRWGQNSLLNLNGVVFTPDNIEQFNYLPRIDGPQGYEARLLNIMRTLEVDLAEHSLRLTEFKVNKRRSWDLVLQNGIEIKLGRNGQLKNLQRFLKTLTILGEDKIAAIAKVDLRYPNGFALTWKPNTPPIDWKKMAATQRH